jgi:hypothetical protein
MTPKLSELWHLTEEATYQKPNCNKKQGTLLLNSTASSELSSTPQHLKQTTSWHGITSAWPFHRLLPGISIPGLPEIIRRTNNMHVFGKTITTEQHIDQRFKSRSMSVFIKLAFSQRTHGCVRCQKVTHYVLWQKKGDDFSHHRHWCDSHNPAAAWSN